MVDCLAIVIYGWKLTGDALENFIVDMDEVDEDWSDNYQDFLIEDSMCGNYIYFGAILGDWDAHEDGGEIIVNSECVQVATDKYNTFIKEFPEVEKVFRKYTTVDPQLYVVQHKW